MSDVAIHPNNTTNIVGQGNVVTAVDKSGNYQVLAPTIDENNVSPSGFRARLKDRFDDPTYYTA